MGGPATGPAADPASVGDPALAQAGGRCVAGCGAGDLPDPWALHDRTEALLATGAEISLSARRHGPDARPHAGFDTFRKLIDGVVEDIARIGRPLEKSLAAE